MHKDPDGRICWDEDEGPLKMEFEGHMETANGARAFVRALLAEFGTAQREEIEAWRGLVAKARKEGLIESTDELRYRFIGEHFEVYQSPFRRRAPDSCTSKDHGTGCEDKPSEA